MQCVSVLVAVRAVLLGLVILTAWTHESSAAVMRYNTATPHTPKYIPLSYDDSYLEPKVEETTELMPQTTGLSPSELILTVFRTVLDVVRGINAKKKTAPKLLTTRNSTRATISRNSTAAQSGRGFEDYYDDHHYHETTTPKPMKQSRYTDPWAGYYDFIINEGSFKFWSVFQLFTTAVLFYSCLSAIYYAKFNPVIPDYDREYDDYFLERSAGRSTRSLESWQLPSGLSWMNSTKFLFILDAISKHYENQ